VKKEKKKGNGGGVIREEEGMDHQVRLSNKLGRHMSMALQSKEQRVFVTNVTELATFLAFTRVYVVCT